MDDVVRPIFFDLLINQDKDMDDINSVDPVKPRGTTDT